MAAEPPTGRADLHIHSDAGDGLAGAEEIVDYAEHALGLDIVAITDHDEIRGALAARDYAARRGYRVQVVTGTEVTTRGGHLLCYGVERTYPYLGSLRATRLRGRSSRSRRAARQGTRPRLSRRSRLTAARARSSLISRGDRTRPRSFASRARLWASSRSTARST